MKLIHVAYYKNVGTDNLKQTKHSLRNTYNLVQILDGEGEFIINDIAYHFTKGSVFMIDTDNFYHAASPFPDTCITNILIINKPLLIQVAKSLGFYEQITFMLDVNKDNSFYLEKKSSLHFNNLFKIIYNDQKPLECAEALIKMITILWENSNNSVQRDKLLSIIFEAINNHIGHEFSLDILSNETNTDKYYLCHYFKSKTGITLWDYLKCQRIEMSKKLLAQNNATIAQIATICGYNSLAYFSKCFKSSTNMTPREYIKFITRNQN